MYSELRLDINFSQKTRVTQKAMPANMLSYNDKYTIMSTKTTRERPYSNEKSIKN